MSWSPIVAGAIAELGRDRSPRCGIHGDRIVERRCSSCDAERHTLSVPSTNADQATQPKEH